MSARAVVVLSVVMAAFAIGAPGQTSKAAMSGVHTSDAEIRAVWEQWKNAFEARDVNGIMELYAPGDTVVAYDLVPPLQYKGNDAYRKDYEDFLAQLDGPVQIEFREMTVYSNGNLGFIHALERVRGKLKNGGPMDFWLRATSGVVKMNGKWYIVHDHVSVPADFATGKAMLDLKP